MANFLFKNGEFPFIFMNASMQQIILPKWRMNNDQSYEMSNKQEVISCKVIKQKKINDGLNYLPFNQTVLSAFRKLTIDYNSPNIELTATEVFSLCVGAKYQSSLGVIHTIKPSPNYFRKVEDSLMKYCIRSGQRFILPSVTNQNEEITPYEPRVNLTPKSSSRRNLSTS